MASEWNTRFSSVEGICWCQSDLRNNYLFRFDFRLARDLTNGVLFLVTNSHEYDKYDRSD